MVLIGTALLLLPGMTTRPLSLTDALFTATSAVTVTGLNVLIPSTDLTLLGQITVLALIQIGGLGFIVLVIATMQLLGRHISLLDRLALSNELGVEQSGSVLIMMRRAVVIMLVIEGIGAVLLYLHWHLHGIVPPHHAAFYAIFHAITAFCNAGFDLFAGLPVYPHGLPDDPLSLIILGILIICGGLGLPVYLDLLFGGRGYRRLSLHTRVTLITSVILVLGGMVGLLIGEYWRGSLLSGTTAPQRILLAWFQSVSARTAGFPGLESFEELHQSSRQLLIGLMFIGSGPASMGGGITTGTFAVLVMSLYSYIRGHRQTRVSRRTVSEDTVRRAMAVFLVSASVVAIASWLLLLTNDTFRIDTVLFETVSALSTTGLSLGITDDLNTFGKFRDHYRHVLGASGGDDHHDRPSATRRSLSSCGFPGRESFCRLKLSGVSLYLGNHPLLFAGI
ncbi:MAG: potassium transporter TrkG [Chloroflexota bacterium]